MLRDQISRLGFPRRIDKWIDTLLYDDVVNQPTGWKDKQQSAISWLSDCLVVFHPGGTKSEFYHEIIGRPRISPCGTKSLCGVDRRDYGFAAPTGSCSSGSIGCGQACWARSLSSSPRRWRAGTGTASRRSGG